jgi:hypothetical protein
MLALAGVWIALASLLLAVAMAVYRPAMTDLTITLVLYFGSPGAMCLAGLTWWAHRTDLTDGGAVARKTQAKIAVGMAIAAAAIVYILIIFSHKFIPLE